MSILRGPADADNFRVKVGRYNDRWYCDPLPADTIASVTPDNEVFPSVSTCKKASGSDWSYVALKRVAAAIDTPTYNRLDQQPYEHRYEALKTINKLGLEAAGRRGTNVHLMAEAHLYGRLPTVGPDDPGADYKPAVDQFFNHYQPTLIAAEFVCIHRTLNGTGYGGTSDAILAIDGKNYLVDWKSRGVDSDHSAYPEEAAQIGAYARADYIIVEGEHGSERRFVPELDGGLIVSIKPDGCRVYPIDLDAAFQHWTALHAWWVARRDERAAVGRQWAARKTSVKEVAPAPNAEKATEPFTEAGEGNADSSPRPSPAPFQGADLSDAEYELLWAKIRHEYDALDTTQREWVVRLSNEARQSAVSFHTRQVQTERSYNLCKATVTLAAGGADDEIVTVLLELVPAPTSIGRFKTLGHWLGSLNCQQAERLAALSDEWATSPDAA